MKLRGPGAGASNPHPRRFPAVTTRPALSNRIVLIGLAGIGLLSGCTRDLDATISAGSTEITRDACGSCHEIPGIEEADGRVGPSLQHFASRQMIAGRLANTPANLERWLKSPQSVKPGGAMPDQNLTDQQVRDAAAYLEQLR